jgi:gas vesicle structural protein
LSRPGRKANREEENKTVLELEGKKSGGGGLADVIDRVLDKGLVINADIAVSLAGVELLGIKIRAALASFETAARYGLEFPGGTSYNTEAWKNAALEKEECPQCGKRTPTSELLKFGCPWCGWQSARALEAPLPVVERV